MDDFVTKPFQEKELILKCLALTTANRDARNIASLHDAIFNRQPAPEGFGKMQSAEFFNNLIQIFLETAPPVFETLQHAVATRKLGRGKGVGALVTGRRHEAH